VSLLIVATWPLVRRRDIERPSTSTQPPGVAHHEAGHAVAAWYFGYPIDFVTIDPAEDFACRCIASPVLKKDGASETDVKPDDYVKVLKAIDVCLAGREADAVSTGRRHWSGSRRDRHLAVALAASLCRDSAEIAALLAWRRIGTHALVVKYTEEIDAVTRALLEHRRLTGNEIRVAINSALARRPTPLNVEGNESL
jgi:ATP-dependent Zn protease